MGECASDTYRFRRLIKNDVLVSEINTKKRGDYFFLLFLTSTLLWPVRFLAGWTESLLVGVASSVISGFLLLRMFCLYHDFMHGDILRKNKWADVLFTVFSVLLLTPKNVWRETHNYHHTNNMRRGATHIGSFKLVIVEDWAAMSPADRKAYKATRHPLTVLLGTITMFIVGMIIMPVLRNITFLPPHCIPNLTGTMQVPLWIQRCLLKCHH